MILTTFIFTILFIGGIYYLIRNLVNLKIAADLSAEALYPTNENEFAGIIIPNEWKQMEPLTKNTKSYQYVKWGTLTVLLVLTILLVIVLTTDWIGPPYFSLATLLFLLINSIRHQGNFFILQKGIILNGKFVSFNQIKHCETEQIVRWHALYGLDSKVNNAFRLTIRLKRTFVQPQFLVVENAVQLKKISSILHQKGVRCESKAA
ncbi:hypothetical protein RCG19_22700 [Neobacillus sp. OS1-2]|uniref:hypothetical protein n=1 Tax=Neobacillus sp. OS1-2 TaxID=3070680 RepID=UPI0027DFFA1B|nr:hypothetical protein [Neobacillus sp. OS1-2]WML39939.1 hypothetical protein RCG19_22700 [Neobacillus sp. OS1-2]